MTTPADPDLMNKLRLAVLLPALSLLMPSLAACTGLQGATAGSCLDRSDSARESSEGFPAPSDVVVWQSAMQVVKEQGYISDPEMSRASDGYIETRWKMSLQPFAGQGFRERVSMKILPIKDRENYFRVETNVMRQMNHNMTQPSSALAAEWAAGQRNAGMERLLNNQLEMMFVPSDVSPEYRAIHGLPEKTEIRDSSVKSKPKEPSWIEKMGG